MNIGVWLERRAQVAPKAPAIFHGTDLVLDYAGFHGRALSVAGWLQAQGVQPGDRVAIFMKNGPDYLIALYGIWYAGAAAVPINSKLHGREAAWIIENAGARIALTSPGLTESLRDAETSAALMDQDGADWAGVLGHAPVTAPVARDPEDLAWLFYTSGTTGRPKGVMITHRMLVGMSLTYLADVDEVTPEQSALYAAPLSHAAGLYIMVHVLMGARHICPRSGGFDEAEIFMLARHHGQVHMFAAPTMVKRMTQVARSVGETGQGLRSVIYAGGPMYLADIVEAVTHFGPIFIQVYGQGECPMSITALSRAEVADRAHPRWRERVASVGRAQSVVALRIGDAQGNPLPVGEVGEIMVRGDTVMPGYWDNPEGTARTLCDGWLMTGDVGKMDADGFLTLQDRSKDVIISGGSNIYPREVEEVLLMHGDVQDVSVVGRPNAEWGEDVVAFVVPRPGASVDEAALGEHCLGHIARFKRPKAYVTLSELPKNNYGKVLKTELRRHFDA